MICKIRKKKDNRLNPCVKCGNTPAIHEGWDTLQVICECGEKGKFFFGDYDDEAFMFAAYGEEAIRDWNSKNNVKKQ